MIWARALRCETTLRNERALSQVRVTQRKANEDDSSYVLGPFAHMLRLLSLKVKAMNIFSGTRDALRG